MFPPSALLPLLLSALLPLLTRAQIPPSWSATFTPSSTKLEATYATNIRLTSGSAGGSLFASEASAPPAFRLSDDSVLAPGARYTILLLDPDAPARGGTGDEAFLHFLGTDYALRGDGGADARQLVAERAPLVEYRGPGQEEEEGVGHRYVVLLYVQKDVEPVVAEVGRERFSVERFERESGVGEAVAGLYFQMAKSGGGKKRRRGRGRDGVDDRVAGVKRVPAGPLGKRGVIRGIAGVAARGGGRSKARDGVVHRRGVIERLDEAWKERIAGLGPPKSKRQLLEELDEGWKKRVAGLGPRDSQRLLAEEQLRKRVASLKPQRPKRQLLEELDEEWKKRVAGLGPRNSKRQLIKELNEAWRRRAASLGPRKQTRQLLEEQIGDEWKPPAAGPQYSKRGPDDAWKQNVAGLGPRRRRA